MTLRALNPTCRYKNCRAFEPKPKEDKRLKGWRARPRTDRGLVGILFLKASKRSLIDFVCLRYLTLQRIAAEGRLNSKMIRPRLDCEPATQGPSKPLSDPARPSLLCLQVRLRVRRPYVCDHGVGLR